MWTHTKKNDENYIWRLIQRKNFFLWKKNIRQDNLGERLVMCAAPSTLFLLLLLEIASSLSPLQQSLAERGGKQALIPPPLFLSRQHFFHSNQEGKEGWSREWVSVNVCEWERERERSLGHAHTHARTRKRKGGGSVLTKDIWLTWRTTTLQDLNLDILA